MGRPASAPHRDVDIAPLAPGDQAKAADVITRAFLDDPLVSFALRRHRAEAMRLLFGALSRDVMRHGGGWGARHAGELVGVSLWLPPGHAPVTLLRHLRSLPDWLRLARLDPSGLLRTMRNGEALDGLHPPEPHWFLSLLAVDTDRRGQGIGRGLVAPGLDVAREARLPVHLDTSRPQNVRIYERLGFEVTGEVQPLPGGPTAWGMTARPH